MDRKTLEYMTDRVERAMDIVDQIDLLIKQMDLVKGKCFKSINILYDSTGFELTKWGSSQVENNYSAEVEAYMLNVFINVTMAEINRLEKELEEL
ncbi:hypothetical protein NST63_00870 [Heyndrickxia sp. FSL W8-0496]|uniref:hypothetical protein n=1 Tax=Heyndrickxia sp. FSL W8-0496 TaxID=2954702 RepID=UPI0030F73E7A